MYPRLGTRGAPVRIAKENRLKGGTGSSGCPEPSLCSRVRRVQPVSPGHKGLICAAEEDDTRTDQNSARNERAMGWHQG